MTSSGGGVVHLGLVSRDAKTEDFSVCRHSTETGGRTFEILLSRLYTEPNGSKENRSSFRTSFGSARSPTPLSFYILSHGSPAHRVSRSNQPPFLSRIVSRTKRLSRATYRRLSRASRSRSETPLLPGPESGVVEWSRTWTGITHPWTERGICRSL